MRNGGGPACLRFRMVLNESEFQHVKPSVWFNMNVYGETMEVINKYYRDNLELNDLRDPNLLIETRTALDEISQILGYRDLYDFQRN
jgi:succinylarginine dihydrolase